MDDLRSELRRLDEALEALELRAEIAGVATSLLGLEKRWSDHFREEERYLEGLGDDGQLRLARLTADRTMLRGRLDHLRRLVGRARSGDAAARDELWITGH